MIYEGKFTNFICDKNSLDEIVDLYNSFDNFPLGGKKPKGNIIKDFIGKLFYNKEYLILGSRNRQNKLIGFMIIRLPKASPFGFIGYSESNNDAALFELEILASKIFENSNCLSYFYVSGQKILFKERTFSLLNKEYNRYDRRIHSIVNPEDKISSNIEQILIKDFIKRVNPVYIIHALLKTDYVAEHFKDNFSVSLNKLKKLMN